MEMIAVASEVKKDVVLSLERPTEMKEGKSEMEFWAKVNRQRVAAMESARPIGETTKIQWRIGIGEKLEAELDEPHHSSNLHQNILKYLLHHDTTNFKLTENKECPQQANNS
ncbi:hypothetical protein L3X38_011638 [Prunus dulcis]|uniref:Uncharacterized protein n=1 Tax=Prunus dulcis TaxID=3755 RepID=A0AAD4ZEH8_PRUDU|nr:hypothetical protein L3X38_011638 [Prunus dulcis]